MGCRTRVMGNVYDPSQEIANGRGNLSFTSINLPRLAIESHGDEALFYEKLKDMMELVIGQLDDRFAIQSKKRVYNFPFLMGQGVWLDSEKLGPSDEVGEVLTTTARATQCRKKALPSSSTCASIWMRAANAPI